MLRLVLTLAQHRVTYRFLLALTAALGFASLDADLGTLESTVCSVLTCVD